MKNKIIENINQVTSIKIVQIVIVLVVLSLIVYFMFLRKSKPYSAPVPKDDPTGTGSHNNDNEIKRIASALHKEIVGVNIWTRKLKPYQDFANLSDTDFVKVYNEYNALYQNEDNETLYEAIDNEMTAWGGIIDGIEIWEQSEPSQVRALVNSSILPRMERLNLK